jgi:hypothetical protein
MLIDAKVDKVALSKPVQKVFNEFVDFLSKNEKELFNKHQ